MEIGNRQDEIEHGQALWFAENHGHGEADSERASHEMSSALLSAETLPTGFPVIAWMKNRRTDFNQSSRQTKCGARSAIAVRTPFDLFDETWFTDLCRTLRQAVFLQCLYQLSGRADFCKVRIYRRKQISVVDRQW